MTPGILQSARYGGDRDLLSRVTADEALKRELSRTEVLRGRSMIRARLLGEALRVNVRLLPTLAESFARLAPQLGGMKPLEAYVFSEPSINAFVAEGAKHLLVGVSSGAVTALSSRELDFVIGHEVGHALYGHLDVPAKLVLETCNLDGERAALLRAWQRAAEVSADRAGLVCCGSIEVAANAMFKTICGLSIPGLTVTPADVAEQWEHLVGEMLDGGRSDQWQISHPLPPLRMRALMTFWQMGAGAAADAEVARLLALMEPSAAPGTGGEDPYLARFLFWGGLYVGLADGTLAEAQRERLRKVAPAGVDAESAMLGGGSGSETALARFQEANKTRRAKLSAAELHRIVTGLIVTTSGDGRVTERELARLYRLGGELNLTSQALDLMISRQNRKG